jgi:hypothetical protein
MQNANDLKECFGRLCFVQMKEPVRLCVPAGDKPMVEPMVGSDGAPVVQITKEGLGVRHVSYYRTVGTHADTDKGQEFVLELEARLFPSESGGRVLLCYEVQVDSGTYIAKMSVAPENIFAVTIISDRKPTEPSRIATPSS